MKSKSARWVVKLGGSLGKGLHLMDWLGALKHQPVVIVPGGGVFADAVRQADQHWHFTPELAHGLAIESMGLYGRMLKGLCEELVPARSLADLRRGLQMTHPNIWFPDAKEVMRDGPPASWSVTSDSLSLWLAQQLEAEHLLLIKSQKPVKPVANLRALVSQGLLDTSFEDTLTPKSPCLWVAGPLDYSALEKGLWEPQGTFTQIDTQISPATALMGHED